MSLLQLIMCKCVIIINATTLGNTLSLLQVDLRQAIY